MGTGEGAKTLTLEDSQVVFPHCPKGIGGYARLVISIGPRFQDFGEQRVGTSKMPDPINLGFLTIVHEPNGYLGGYLLTNQWGRPLEFRLSTAVQPNRVQQILYGDTLEPYLCADLIGKTLVEKASVVPHLILTDCAAALELRQRLETPVAWLAGEGYTSEGREMPIRPICERSRPILCHQRFPQDRVVVQELLDRLEGLVDPAEPFARIREAMTEARKIGVTRN
jgi:hypothetical protein